MKHRSYRLFFALFLFLQAFMLEASEGVQVVVSIKPVHSILSGLMVGTTGPELLVGEGEVPYSYQLSKDQKAALQAADLVVWVGPELEKFLGDEIKGLGSDTSIVTLLDNPDMKILPSRFRDDERDPFFWLDSRNALILIDELSRQLISIDPGRTHLYKRNRDALYEKVAELDRKLEYGYRGLKRGIGLEYYDTLQYFEQAYALKIKGIISESPLHQVSAETLLTERENLRKGSYACLLTEKGMVMPEYALLTEGVTFNKAELDSLGTGFKPGPDLYLELMEHNTRVIKACLETGNGDGEQEDSEEINESVYGKIGGKFLLTDHNGNLVTEKDMQGKYQLLYFGYTFCPDVCPTSLQVTTAALKLLGDKADQVQPYFITVDPERDTQEVMAGYVTYFHKDLIGLVGSRSMTDRLIKQFNLVVEKVVEEGADPDNYIMDHTASVFLMAPDGRFITKFAHGITPQQMVEKLNEYMR